MNENEQAVANVLQQYREALNASDTDAVMRLYAPDGVFMPQGSPSSVGSAAVQSAYQAVFRSITLHVQFELVEVHQVSPEWIFARTNSAGETNVHATGAKIAEANQELFLFQKLDGAWKIARYCFSTTNPPKA